MEEVKAQIEKRSAKQFMGYALIILGIVLFILELVAGPRQTELFIVLGCIFVAGYFARKSYGLLVPGCILLGLGVGSIGERAGIGFYNFDHLWIGISFLAIYLIDRVYRGSTHWWPIIPGCILVLSDIVRRNETTSNIWSILTTGWPLILVLIGLVLIARSRSQAN
jgi:hypothetical protein